jgi:predicted O-linked N-acetylglucosamine transferase (SPINDLY family)
LASVQQSSVVTLFLEADRLDRVQGPQGPVELYKNWIAMNSGNPVLHAIYFNYGVALVKAGDRAGAINALRECIRLKPDFYPPYINLGRALEDGGQLGAAIGEWLALVNSLPVVNGDAIKHKLIALQQLGRVLEATNNDATAEDVLKQALDINSNQPEVAQHWIALRQRQCKWPVIEGWEYVEAKTLLQHISPLSLANLVDDPMFQLARACDYAKHAIGVPTLPSPRVAAPAGSAGPRKLRIGYVSSDLREHAVGFGMTELFETHDRNDFEIYAYYCGIDRSDATQQRIKNSVDRWVEIRSLSDAQAAKQIADDGIDILVDLNGYTKDARTKVFALRPAPVIVNWFGFPGTMGTPYHHYLIADPHIIPEGYERYYSEKVMRLPCYQPNDRRRTVAARRPARGDEGLPQDAFVYCCLNGMQKLTPSVFNAWMSILNQVPNSVLWLLGGPKDTNARVCQRAEQHGVSPDRLIFAEKRPNPEHLARYPLADIFLDTHPYGAHTTAADAMWMGVPLLTVPGRSFASRVCTSLLHAAGIGDLVCPTMDVYVTRAIELGRSPEKVAAIKQRLIAGRDTCLLFDTTTLARHLEDLFRQMWREYEAGSLPVPDLTNLEAYCQIGLELNLEDAGGLTDEAYRSRYEAKLEAWHRTYPLRPDLRFWNRTLAADKMRAESALAK